MPKLFSTFGFIIVFFLIIILPQIFKIVQEYERGVVFRLGRYAGVRGPGLIILIPLMERMVKVDLRIITMDVPAQEVITRDNVTIKVNAVVYFKVVEPENAIIRVEHYMRATSQYAQTALRSILGQSELDEILSHTDEVNVQLQKIIDEATDSWGIKVTAVELKDVELPQTMQRAMAKQAEAEREKRAKIIHAEGESLAVRKLTEAAEVMTVYPAALQLRYLQTLAEIAVEKSSTILFPVPIDTLSSFLQSVGGKVNPDLEKPATEKPSIEPPKDSG
ncbi:MAG: slipin family protein [Candidatus Eremiobacteraeota bacterium]|nr:slipin family protein [Candidatus Eremiobacteraeota bacterium]